MALVVERVDNFFQSAICNNEKKGGGGEGRGEEKVHKFHPLHYRVRIKESLQVTENWTKH